MAMNHFFSRLKCYLNQQSNFLAPTLGNWFLCWLTDLRYGQHIFVTRKSECCDLPTACLSYKLHNKAIKTKKPLKSKVCLSLKLENKLCNQKSWFCASGSDLPWQTRKCSSHWHVSLPWTTWMIQIKAQHEIKMSPTVFPNLTLKHFIVLTYILMSNFDTTVSAYFSNERG